MNTVSVKREKQKTCTSGGAVKLYVRIRLGRERENISTFLNYSILFTEHFEKIFYVLMC